MRCHKKLATWSTVTSLLEMFFISLALFCRAEYVEITKDNAKQLIGGPKPVFVKFYSPNCGHCRAMAEDFAEAATTFTDVIFAGVDCTANNAVCDSHKVDGYPTLKLFLPGKTDGIEFSGTRSVDSFCDFIENYTQYKAKRPPQVMHELNPLNFEKRITEEKCTFLTFYAPWCGHCKRFLPQARIAAASLVGEPNISVSKVNCDQYHELCESYGVQGFPTIKLFKGSTAEPLKFEGHRTADAVIDFINKECGTEREVGGLLNERAGLIEAAAPVVEEFLTGDRAAAIEKMKAIPGAEFYVKVMDRYQQKGKEQVEKDMETMMGILTAKKSSWAALDGMKKRYNVFAQFIPKPTPTPEPEAAEAAAAPEL